MIDSLLTSQSKADQSTILERLGLYESKSSNGNTCAPKPYSLLTLHRPANVDNADAFFEILKGLEELAESSIVIFPVHPRTKQRIQQYRLDSYFSSEESIGTESRGIRMVEPLGYLDFLCLMKHASIVITDSGGIQEETTCLGIPCVTVRENTERPITIQSGTNLLAGVRRDGIRKCVREQRARQRGTRIPEKWDGHAAERILEVISRQKPRAAALPAYNSASYIYPRG
jgi:UDP-N-acetylglucosamine 2-epimerase (non-hydrolysing)